MVFIGISLIALGVVIFVFSYFYGWISVTPDVDAKAYSHYQLLSTIFGISSLVVFVGGWITVILAIRRANQNYRNEQRKKLEDA